MDNEFMKQTLQWIKKSTQLHKGAVIGGCVGLLFAILLFTVGLFKMLVVALFVLIGVAIGQIYDGKATILSKIRTLFSDKN